MDEEKEDRISSLPDCLLLEIISRINIKHNYEKERKLTTKEVIETTANLSKRWKYLWIQLPNLEIYYQGGRGYAYDDFTYIDKTQTQCPTNVNLKKLILTSKTYHPISQVVYSWIRHAINRKVQEVDLCIRYYHFELFSYDDELFFNNSCFRSMNIRQCIFNPPNGVIRWDNLKCLCIKFGKLVDDLIGIILAGSPCLETLELKQCYGVRKIDTTSKRFKKLVLTGYGLKNLYHTEEDYINTIKINAPCMLSLTINGGVYLKKILLLNVSSLVKAELCYQVNWHFANKLGRTLDDIKEELLSGLLSSLGHVNEIMLSYECLEVLSCLKAKGFKFFKDVTSPGRHTGR